MKLMDRLAIEMHGKRVGYPQEVADELNTIEYRMTKNGISYDAAQGHHDDMVMALGLALLRLREPAWGWGV